jgi:hypothetical protein
MMCELARSEVELDTVIIYFNVVQISIMRTQETCRERL